ncbi:MAG TPA: hypothetical protein VF824_01700 [Thermoanaerobaculia bacterium]|jgi:hypothetical protein
MESEIDRIYRQTWPALWPRFNAQIRPRILRALQTDWLIEIYVRVTSIVIFTFTITGLAALVACYYYGLRNRRHYTALTEAGLGRS